MDMEESSSSKQKSKPRLVACRECHRSKLKCDRTYPCKSCIKRGCADICPDGTLVATKRQKSAIEASQLREKTAIMADRIRQLEEALAVAHAKTSTDVHGLLVQTEDGQNDHSVEQQSQSNSTNNDVIDAFGTLSIGSDGRSKYHNQSAGADYFAEAESPDVPTAGARAFEHGEVLLPSEIVHLASLFPFGPSEAEPLPCLKEDLMRYLPPADIAWGICDIFFSHGDWLFDAITRAEFTQEIYSHIYHDSTYDSVGSDRLSLMFIVLALGTLLDTAKLYDIRSSEPFYQLAKAAFVVEPLIDAATIPTLQSLHFQIVYLYMTDRQTVEHRWLNMGLLAKLTYSTGLHRDSRHWIRDNPQENERRRKLFWEIYTYDSWISFIMGRPPSFNPAHIQCPLPADRDPLINEKGQVEPSFHHIWKYVYRRECLIPVVEQAFAAKSPSYATILRLDRMVREFEIPKSLQLGTPGDPTQKNSSLSLSMQRYMLFCEKETSLLYLHRSFFAQAVCDCPDNPLESKYATSVSATYRSACLIVAGTHDATVRHPELAARFWWFWSNLFSAAIVLGSIVTRSPACQLSVSAMNELDLACNLMEHRAAAGRSARAVPILQRLRDKARAALSQLSQGSIDKASPQSNSNSSSKDDEHDELAIYAGRTRFIQSSNRSRSPTGSPQGMTRSSPRLRRASQSVGPTNTRMRVPQEGGSPGSYSYRNVPSIESEVFRDAHPALLDYMRDINGYEPPAAIVQGFMASRNNQTNESTTPIQQPIIKAEIPSVPTQSFPWPDQTGSVSTTMPPDSNTVASNYGGVPYTHPGGGIYVPGVAPDPGALMAQAVGTFGYPSELNGDGTWQQLMVQLGVMDGQT
ncbi:hypothetical protein M422DRAFT_208868 [Sphaerobolus stellatus SS14]|uniref:Zn(2)-C6 fungal-type domain-containing protein n=1 Tax=Sphaerobolus stellatus (strain SS14) TaxID=990650 RepID=A0A0C9VUW5_SPHS4|nr:hypothetical protein M422DRAFT_208868 [Sphaerobolus stellatus SS14]